MSRYRKVQVSIWNDDKFPFLDSDSQLVFFHLLTTPLSNSIGIFKISDKALSAELRMQFRRYKKAFEILEKIGMVQYDDTAQLIYLPKFLRHNPPDNPNVITAWANLFNELPKSILKTKYFNELYLFVEKLGKGFRERFKECFGIPLIMETRATEQEDSLNTSKAFTTNLSYNQDNEVDIFSEILKNPKDQSNMKTASKKQHLEFVWLTNSEIDNLIKKFGNDYTLSMISRLNNYIGSKGVKYKSHYYTILNWIEQDKRNNIIGKASNTAKTQIVSKSEKNDIELKRFLAHCDDQRAPSDCAQIETQPKIAQLEAITNVESR
jgi:hypothetical protein